MIPHDELHVVFGTGPVGLAVMHELHGQGKRVRMVNRSGTAATPQSVEVVKGNAADQASHTRCARMRRSSTTVQRALYRLGRAFTSYARRHYPGRGSGQCEARRDREPLNMYGPVSGSDHRSSSLPPHHT